jgi:RND family efflux transporter MFP subunit
METKPIQSRRFAGKIRQSLPAFLVVAGLVGIILVLSVFVGKKGEAIKAQNEAKLKKERPPVNVVALDLVPMPIRDRINLPGTTLPWVQLQVLAEITGKITEKTVEEGRAVKKGATLVAIDDRDYRNAYQSAKASHNLAQADLDRLNKLYQKQAIPQSRLDDAIARVKNTRANMNNAALALERTAIQAPIDGVVNRLLVEKGQYLNVGDPIAEILQMTRIKVRVGIPESDVDAVRRLDAFKVRIDALGGKTFQAKKYYLSKTADAMARLYNLDLALDNHRGEILPDMFVRVEIVKREIPDGIAVPIYSIITRDDAHIVYVVKDNMAHLRNVTLGLLEGWQVEIKDGLRAGDQVIVVGHRSVNDGDMVKVVRTVADIQEIIQ